MRDKAFQCKEDVHQRTFHSRQECTLTKTQRSGLCTSESPVSEQLSSMSVVPRDRCSSILTLDWQMDWQGWYPLLRTSCVRIESFICPFWKKVDTAKVQSVWLRHTAYDMMTDWGRAWWRVPVLYGVMLSAVVVHLSADNSTGTSLGWAGKNDTTISTIPTAAFEIISGRNETDSPGIFSGVTEGSKSVQYTTLEDSPNSMENYSDAGYHFDLNATNIFLATDVTKYICGSDRLCNYTLSPENGHCTVDCYPCQCDEMCHFYGDCCPDVLFGNSRDSPSTPFPYVSCSKEYWTVWGNSSDILMVSSCPPDADIFTADRCERPDKDDQEQATPVSVFSSQITYRNIFCAQCHSVLDAQSWRHHVACRTTSALNRAKSKADLWRRVLADNECKIESFPPDGIAVRECFHSEVNSCSGNPDPVIENLCLSFRHTVDYYGESLYYTSYGNIFCAVCNGARLDKSMSCQRMKSPFRPLPLNVLLDFNPKSGQPQTAGKDIRMCENDRAFDPFSDSCRNVTCYEGRRLKDGICEELIKIGHCTGYFLDVTLSTANSSTRIPDTSLFMGQYLATVHRQLTDFHPFVITNMTVSFYIRKDVKYVLPELPELVTASGNILINSQTNSSRLEKALFTMMSQDFSYNASGDFIQLLSKPYFCPQPLEDPAGMKVLSKAKHFLFLSEESPKRRSIECFGNVTYQTIPLSCPFVEYPDRFEENFTFDPVTHVLEFGNYSFLLNTNEFRCCGRVLRICVDTVANMARVIFGSETQTFGRGHDLALSIVSLVCMSLSLVGLLLTFLIYCALPNLRTLPGKNSMALIFHLFCSHLLFLTTSNRTSNVVLCQVFGVLLHYFWMASFTWMLISAYHMYTVFTSVRAYLANGEGDKKTLIMYSLCSILIPVLIIASCIVTHAVQKEEIGYGGRICFLNNPTAIGVFFVAPLTLILVVNAVFFTKTILAIKSVPDMKEASNKSKKLHVFVYIKLSLLFGFTWTFGILASVLQSTVLEYIFTILTGGQGVMIFLAYCVNGRTWAQLKDRISGDEKSGPNMNSNNRCPISTDTRHTFTP